MAADLESGASPAVHKREEGLVNGGRLSAFLSALSRNGWQVESCQGQVLQASRTRPVLRYRLSYVDDGRELSVDKIVIGKAYYRGDGARTYEFMRELWARGFAEDPRLRIPEPLAWVPELHLLLQGQAPGHALYDLLGKPATALAQVRASGRWLAKLHSTPIDRATVLPPDHERRKLSRYSSGLAEALPASAARINDLTAGVLSLLTGARNGPLVPTHGDYQPKNIYIAPAQVTVIDWDRFGLAHPARDLGHFLGQSMTMSFVRTDSFGAISAWNEAFLEEYRRHCHADVDTVLATYLVRTFLEILHYKLVVRPVRNPTFVPVWLDECERWLETAMAEAS